MLLRKPLILHPFCKKKDESICYSITSSSHGDTSIYDFSPSLLWKKHFHLLLFFELSASKLALRDAQRQEKEY
jgi:hypothetical protein